MCICVVIIQLFRLPYVNKRIVSYCNMDYANLRYQNSWMHCTTAGSLQQPDFHPHTAISLIAELLLVL